MTQRNREKPHLQPIPWLLVWLVSAVHFHVGGSPDEVIKGYIVVIGELYEQSQGNCLEAAFVTAVDCLGDAKHLCHLCLGQIGVFPHVADALEMHARILPARNLIVPIGTILHYAINCGRLYEDSTNKY